MRPAFLVLLLALAPHLPLRALAARDDPPAGSAPPPAATTAPPPVSPVLDPYKALEGPVTLNARDVPFRTVIDLLFQGRGLNYAVDAAVPNPPMTLTINNQPFRTVLRTVVRLASASVPGLTYSQDNNLFLIKLRAAPPAEAVGPPAERAPEVEDIRWEKIPLNYVDVAVVIALLGGGMVPGAAEAQASAAPASSPAPRAIGPRDRLSPEPLPVPRPAGGSPAAAGGSGPGGGTAMAAPAPMGGFNGYGDPRVGLGGFGGGGLSGGLGWFGVPSGNLVSPNLTILGQRGDNSLIVRGVDENIAELKTLLRLIDLPLKQVRVRLSTGQLTAEGQAMNGSTIQLSDAAGASRLAAAVVPRINGDGTVSLEINGSLTAGGATHPLATQARVTPGESAQLFTVGEGNRAIRIWAKATVVPDPLEGDGGGR